MPVSGPFDPCKSEGGDGEGITNMTNEEAALRLELCNPNQHVPSDRQGPKTDKDDEAHEVGAAALRELDELKKWAEAGERVWLEMAGVLRAQGCVEEAARCDVKARIFGVMGTRLSECLSLRA